MSDNWRTLSDIYDADKARRDPAVMALRPRLMIPHPLVGVEYADGAIIDTTAGHVRCVACSAGLGCKARRSARSS